MITFLGHKEIINFSRPSDDICVGNQGQIGPDNGLSPIRYQSIVWTNPGLFIFGLLGTNFGQCEMKHNNCYSWKQFENVVYKIISILSQSRCNRNY